MSDSETPMDCSMPGFPLHHQLTKLLKLMSIELVMPSNHLILCYLLLLPPSVPENTCLMGYNQKFEKKMTGIINIWKHGDQ